MVRIFPHDPVPRPTRRPIRLSAARGECECGQIGVYTTGFHANSLSAEAEGLSGPGGSRIPAANVELFYPEYVPAKWPTAGQNPADVERPAPNFYPDPLMPEWKLPVAGPEAPKVKSVWVRVRVPRDAAPGIYRGRITVRAAHRDLKSQDTKAKPMVELTGTVRLQLRVWDFELPSRTGMLMTNWFFPDQVSEWYGLPMWSSRFWELLDQFAADMSGHRQNVVLTPLLGGARSEDQMVQVSRRGRGHAFGFGRFDRWCRLFLQHGFELIEGGHIASGCRRATPFWVTGTGGSSRRLELNAQDPRFERFLRQFAKSLWDHLDRRGWQGHYVQHISDEPSPADVPAYRRLAGILREAAPGVKLIDAIAHSEFADLIDFPVPLESHYQQLLNDSGRSPGKVWVYYCCGPTGPWPNRFLDYWLIRLRIITWLCFMKGIPGFLHWGYNYWRAIRKRVHNPWDDSTTHRHPAGDPMMVYPPRDEAMAGAGVIGSIRWEIVREAMEDYEYLRLTRELADRGVSEAQAILEEVARKVVPDWTTYTRDHACLEQIRERMGTLLSRNTRGR
jgi:hypothetical protein